MLHRPEFGVERVSYEVMTPSAARGVLEAIFWKPEFRWRVREVIVLKSAKRDFHGNPVDHPEDRIRHFSILRNEMNSIQSDRSARSWAENGGGYFADDDRAQRHTLCLRDVAYVIRADIELKPHAGSIRPSTGTSFAAGSSAASALISRTSAHASSLRSLVRPMEMSRL